MAPRLTWNPEWEALQNSRSLISAAHFSSIEEFKALFNELKNGVTLRAELERHDPIGQNILHVAMKDVEMFKMCLNSMLDLGLDLPQFITEPTQFGDNLLHAFVQFGRVDSLRELLEADDPSYYIYNAFKDASLRKNIHQETPLDILHDPKNSRTLAFLRDEDANWSQLDQSIFDANLEEILTLLPAFRPQPIPESEDDTSSVASEPHLELDAHPEQGWLNMQVMSLFVAGLGVSAVALGVIALCAPSLLLAASIAYAAVGLAATVLGGIGFFAQSRPRNIEPPADTIPQPLSLGPE